MDLAAIALIILNGVGGKENIASLTYCATRLRLSLKDFTRVDNGRILNIPLVKNTFNTRGEYQIVIGSDLVEALYHQLMDTRPEDILNSTDEHRYAVSILHDIGGEENLLSLAYCATRLRIELSDYEKVDDEKIRQLESVKSAFLTRGQYQIVIKDEQVKQIYEAMTSLIDQQVCGEKRNYGKLKTLAKSIFGTR